jgi:hypothetical protein
MPLQGLEIVHEVAAEISRVVGVHGHDKPLLKETQDRMSGEIVDDAQLQIGQRAHGQWYLRVRQALQERRILLCPHPVIDAGDTQ